MLGNYFLNNKKTFYILCFRYLGCIEGTHDPAEPSRTLAFTIIPTWLECSIIHSSYTYHPCHVHGSHLSPWRPWSEQDRASPAVTGVSRQRWRSRSSRCSRPSVPSVRPTHRGVCASVSAGAPWRGWPPQVTRSRLLQRKIKAHTHTNGLFQVCKNRHAHIRQLRVLQRKCSDGKAYIRLLQLWPEHKLLLRCSLGSLENLNFQNIFRGHTRHQSVQACGTESCIP